MGVRFPSVGSTTIIASPSAGAEVVVCTTPPINEPIDNAQVLLFWYLLITIGTTATTLFATLRRGLLVASTPLNSITGRTVVAANVNQFSGCYFDFPGIVAGQQYSLSVQLPAATAASTVADVCLVAMVL